MLMLDGGLRVSEVVTLNESDILTNQLVIRNSKNNKDRAVVLSPIMKKEIIRYQRIKKKRYYGKDKDAFIVSYKQRRLNEKAIWQMLREITKMAGTRNMNPHLLRHTYASMQLKNGLDIFTLSLNMGHSEISTTQEYLKSLKSEDFLEKSLQTSTLMNL